MALVTPEFLQTKTYTALRDRLAFAHGGRLQAGVWGANDFKVVQRAAGANMSVDVGAGFALVAANNAGNAGLYHIENNATTNVVIPAAHATLPRLDQIVVDVSDSTSGGDAGDVPALTVVGGTATSGATLANRLGAAALPSNTLRIADVLVGAAVTSITTTNIMDRRPWARGIDVYMAQTGGSASATTSGIDLPGTQVRLECSGVPLRILADGFASIGNFNDGVTADLSAIMDASTTLGGTEQKLGTNTLGTNYGSLAFSAVVTPTAGSHLFKLRGTTNANGGGAVTITFASSGLSVMEMIGGNPNNGTA